MDAPSPPDRHGDASAPFSWADQLADQIDWHWHHQARPRLDGLSDEEYLWEPTPGAWSIRPRGTGRAVEVGSGDAVIDFALPEPEPPPVTTIAWRLGHVIVGVLGLRNATYFGGEPIDYDAYAYTLRAEVALAALDAGYARWVAGVRGLTDADLRAPCAEAGRERDPMAALVLHIDRELIHHLAEIALLRDLYAQRERGPDSAPADILGG